MIFWGYSRCSPGEGKTKFGRGLGIFGRELAKLREGHICHLGGS